MQNMINPKHEILKESQISKVKMQNDKAKFKNELKSRVYKFVLEAGGRK